MAISFCIMILLHVVHLYPFININTYRNPFSDICKVKSHVVKANFALGIVDTNLRHFTKLCYG